MFWSKHLCPSCHPTSITIYLSFPNFIQTIEPFQRPYCLQNMLTSTFSAHISLYEKIKSRKSSTRPPAPQARCLNRWPGHGVHEVVGGWRPVDDVAREMVRSWVQDKGATHEDDDDGLCVGGGGSIAMSLKVPDLSRFSSSDVTHFLSYVIDSASLQQ